jgi:DNA repair protein RecO (recombination protein O)
MANLIEDDALVLGTRLSGETGLLLYALSQNHGLVRGYVAGGVSRRFKASLQIGQPIYLHHSSRHSELLGQIRFEPNDHSNNGDYEPLALLGLQSAAFLLHTYLPDFEPVPGLFAAFSTFGEFLQHEEIWPYLYVKLEIGLLEALGFGLDLSICAVTGSKSELTYVSPRSGRAVSREAGLPYHNKLLTLPAFLCSAEPKYDENELENGLSLTSFFLHKHLFGPMNRPSPSIREELIRALLGRAAI